jgi:hypothetical protein
MILQRNTLCKIMKKSILRPKYGWGEVVQDAALPSEQAMAPGGAAELVMPDSR